MSTTPRRRGKPGATYGIYVDGAGVYEKLAETVMAILAAPHADEETKRIALSVIGQHMNQPLSITGCNVSIGAGRTAAK